MKAEWEIEFKKVRQEIYWLIIGTAKSNWERYSATLDVAT